MVESRSRDHSTHLRLVQVKVLKGCFDGFADEDGAIPADNVGGILSMMGMKVKPSALKEIIEEIDEDGNSNHGIMGTPMPNKFSYL